MLPFVRYSCLVAAVFSPPFDTGLLDKDKSPHSFLIQPVLSDSNELVGLLQAMVSWDAFITSALPLGVEGIYAVLNNSCGGGEYTFLLNGTNVRYTSDFTAIHST